MLYALIAMSFLMPILCIGSFIVGYNISAPKKILKPKKKVEREKSDDEIMLERIDNARI